MKDDNSDPTIKKFIWYIICLLTFFSVFIYNNFLRLLLLVLLLIITYLFNIKTLSINFNLKDLLTFFAIVCMLAFSYAIISLNSIPIEKKTDPIVLPDYDYKKQIDVNRAYRMVINETVKVDKYRYHVLYLSSQAGYEYKVNITFDKETSAIFMILNESQMKKFKTYNKSIFNKTDSYYFESGFTNKKYDFTAPAAGHYYIIVYNDELFPRVHIYGDNKYYEINASIEVRNYFD